MPEQYKYPPKSLLFGKVDRQSEVFHKMHESGNQRGEVRLVQHCRTIDSSTHKFYHIHGMNSRHHLDLYFSDKEDMVFGEESFIFPLVNLHYKFSSGHIRGNLLIDISFGSYVHHLYSASNFFKEMVVLKSNEHCIMEVSRWQHDRTGAYDWKHASSFIVGLEGKRDQHEDIEMRLKSCIKQVLKCNFEQENIISPMVLPLADCVFSALLLDVISKNEDEYMRNLEKIIKLLKPQRQLILFGLLDTTYITVGGHRLHFLKYDESFVKNAFNKLGLVIDYCAVQRRRNVSDLIDHGAIIFVVAHKRE
ncbi:nicotinamide N-methyltransferase-like [Lithobates pipiens]